MGYIRGYEYQFLIISNRSVIVDTLNAIGKDGWRVVGSSTDEDNWYFTMEREYMKRDKD